MDTLSPLFGSPSSPVKSSSEADRDIIVRSVLQFIDPEVAQVLRTTSFAYESSVARAEADRALDKRRVEELIGEELPNVQVHNWAQTYKLAETSPLVLAYTGNEIDQYVAKKLGWERYDESTPALALAAREKMIKEAEASAETGNVLSLKVVLKYLGPLTRDEYWSIAMEAIYNLKQAILEVSEIFARIQDADEEDIDAILEATTNSSIPPQMFDFLLTNVDLTRNVPTKFSYLYSLIKDGMIGNVKVMLKHELFNPFEKVVDDQYVDNHSIHAYTWWPIWLAACYGHVDIVAFFLTDPRLDAVKSFTFSMRDVVVHGHERVFRMLFETGKLDDEGGEDEYLVLAAKGNHLDIARVIFDRLSTDDWVFNVQPLRAAVNNDRMEIALLILSSPVVRLNQQQKNELIATAKYNENVELERTIRLHG